MTGRRVRSGKGGSAAGSPNKDHVDDIMTMMIHQEVILQIVILQEVILDKGNIINQGEDTNTIKIMIGITVMIDKAVILTVTMMIVTTAILLLPISPLAIYYL